MVSCTSPPSIPNDLTLTIDDFRYIRHSQLATLTGIDPSYFSAWSHQRTISERNLERIAQKLGISKTEFLSALELRRQDAATARQAQAKANRLIQFLQQAV